MSETPSLPSPRERSLWIILRVAAAMCFIGHGAFGIITKEAWLPFFALVGIGPGAAYALMPVVGAIDIALGVAILLRPTRAVMLYMTLWGAWTAALRPLTGDSVFEMMERAGNYGVPLALLLWVGVARGAGGWLSSVALPSLNGDTERLVRRTLTATIALLLVGHGGLAIGQKPLLVEHFAAVGLSPAALQFSGFIELALAAMVLVAPRPSLLLGIVAWKVGTELLFPLTGDSLWEFIERGGSYGAPLALAVMAGRASSPVRERASSRRAVLSSGIAALVAVASVQGEALAQRGSDGPVPEAQLPYARTQHPGLLDSLRAGGHVLACRHTETHHDQTDRGPQRAMQRNLTERGVQDAKRIGAAVQALRIPIGEVRANPMYRNRETAEHAFGSMTVDSSLAGGSRGLLALLGRPVPPGTNRALVTRIGILNGAFKDHDVRSIEEGDCIVTRPVEGGTFRVVARLGVDDWERLGAARR